MEREGFPQQFAEVVERLGEGTLSRSKAAMELGISRASLNRFINARLAAIDSLWRATENVETPSLV